MSYELLVHFKYLSKPMNNNAMFLSACSANDSLWVKIIKISVIIGVAFHQSMCLLRKPLEE